MGAFGFDGWGEKLGLMERERERERERDLVGWVLGVYWPKVQRHRRDGKGQGKVERIFYADVAAYVVTGHLCAVKIIFYFNC